MHAPQDGSAKAARDHPAPSRHPSPENGSPPPWAGRHSGGVGRAGHGVEDRQKSLYAHYGGNPHRCSDLRHETINEGRAQRFRAQVGAVRPGPRSRCVRPGREKLFTHMSGAIWD
ncbi:hypothetical protein RZS08_10190, partial [Arthrospira platensis SPKY1]|nr:hypothetical protein [Arthrospira platensis SPKY1]